jgi:hypothetical protein
MRKLMAGTCLLALWSGSALAQAECDAALVQSTYASWDSSHADWRLATKVTKEMYETIKQGGGANAVIYGVPVGADYNEFRNRVNQEMTSHQESLTMDQARNIMWTGLDPSSPSVYAQCIDAVVRNTRGLHLAVRSATESDISLIVGWNPEGPDPTSIRVTWSPPALGGVALPRQVTAGTQIVVLPRPSGRQQIAVNFPGFADSTILEPLPRSPRPTLTPASMGCGTLTPNLSATAYSDVQPGGGFDPKTFTATGSIAVPVGDTPSIARTASEYHWNGGGEASIWIDMACTPLQRDATRLRSIVRLDMKATALSGHCCSGFGPGGTAKGEPKWTTIMNLPGEPAQKWAFSLVINAENSFPAMSCGISLDGNVTNLSLAGTQTLSPSLIPGDHQLALQCSEGQEFGSRPGNWDFPASAGTDITMIIDAVRQ